MSSRLWPKHFAARLKLSEKPICPVIDFDSTPASNSSRLNPIPERRLIAALNRDISTTRRTLMRCTSQAMPVTVSRSASKIKPGFKPTPRTDTRRFFGQLIQLVGKFLVRQPGKGGLFGSRNHIEAVFDPGPHVIRHILQEGRRRHEEQIRGLRQGSFPIGGDLHPDWRDAGMDTHVPPGQLGVSGVGPHNAETGPGIQQAESHSGQLLRRPIV